MTAYSKGRIKLVSSLFFVFVFLFTACKKSDTNTIGANFIGARDGFNVNLTDTTSLILYSVHHDSIPTKTLTYYMLGSMNDPVFGTSHANIYTQFSLPVDQFSLGQNASIDSVVIRLKPVASSSYFGNLSTPQEILVYELKEALSGSADSGYFSNRDYQITESGRPLPSGAIGYFSGTLDLASTYTETVGGITSTLDPHIRIRLSNAFVNKLESAEKAGAFLTTDAFKSYISGLAILASIPDGQLGPGQGAIVNMDLRSSVSAVAIYYTNSTGQQKADFPFAPTDIKGNQYKHSTSLPLQPYISKTHFNECYIQSTGGIKTRVLMPNILGIAKNQAVAIIGAEMVFTVQDGKESDPLYPVPYNLLLVGSDDQGRNAFLADQFEIFPQGYYGGIYNPTTHEYRFNIIRHVQQLLNTYRSTGQDVNYGMNLIIPADDYLSGIGAGRVILNTNTALKKVKLNLSYTVIQ